MSRPVARPLQPDDGMRFILSLVAVLSLATGCGAGSTNPPGGGGVDAAAGSADAQSGNALGQTCTTSADCPSTPAHQCVFLQSGNPNLGYCSPMCSVNSDCMGGYTGPATGTPTCFVPDQPNVCSILCTAEGDCPGDLTCVITGGPVNVCATKQ